MNNRHRDIFNFHVVTAYDKFNGVNKIPSKIYLNKIYKVAKCT